MADGVPRAPRQVLAQGGHDPAAAPQQVVQDGLGPTTLAASSAWAMGEQLRKLGTRLAEPRSTALFQLAIELPAAVLARTLGIDITVAVKWQRAAAGDWGAYAAEIVRRNSKADPCTDVRPARTAPRI
ncbi:hypothetical protein ACWCPX_35075 [Streptomyces olivaceoviridis]